MRLKASPALKGLSIFQVKLYVTKMDNIVCGKCLVNQITQLRTGYLKKTDIFSSFGAGK